MNLTIFHGLRILIELLPQVYFEEQIQAKITVVIFSSRSKNSEVDICGEGVADGLTFVGYASQISHVICGFFHGNVDARGSVRGTGFVCMKDVQVV